MLLEKHAIIQKVKDLEHQTTSEVEKMGDEMKKIAYERNSAEWELKDSIVESKTVFDDLLMENTAMALELSTVRQQKKMRDSAQAMAIKIKKVADEKKAAEAAIKAQKEAELALLVGEEKEKKLEEFRKEEEMKKKMEAVMAAKKLAQ